MGGHFYFPWTALGKDMWPHELHLAFPKAARLPGCFVQLENKQSNSRVWPCCGLGEKFPFLYCWAKEQVCGPVCPFSSSWLSQCDLSLVKEWHGPSAEKEEPWCRQMQKWLKQNNILSWGEQGGFVLPTSRVQVGHKGGK